MKLYMFDSETGLYEGEDFGENRDINISEGITDIVPPDFNRGETLLFNLNSQTWTVIKIDNVRPMLVEKRLQAAP